MSTSTKTEEAVLSSKARKQLPKTAFAIPPDRYPIHDLAHARNALARVAQHGSEDEKKRVRAAVYRRYPALKKRAEEAALEEVESKAYPGLERSPKKNWVEQVGGLPSYIERVAKHLHYEKGYPISRAIATAINHAKKMCSTGRAFGGKVSVSGKARAVACKAVADWEAKKARSKGKSVSEAAWMEPREPLSAEQFQEIGRLIRQSGLTKDEAHEIAESAQYRRSIARGLLRALKNGDPAARRSAMEAGFALLVGTDGAESRELAESMLDVKLPETVSTLGQRAYRLLNGTEATSPVAAMRVALEGVVEVEGALMQALGHTRTEEAPAPAPMKAAPRLGQTATPVKGKQAASRAQAQNPEFEKQHPRSAKGRVGGGTWIAKKGQGDIGKPDDVVRQAQERLTQLGFKLSPDGRFGAVTEEALKNFQKATGLEPTGVVDEATAETMRNPPMEAGKLRTVSDVRAEEKAAAAPTRRAAGTSSSARPSGKTGEREGEGAGKQSDRSPDSGRDGASRDQSGSRRAATGRGESSRPDLVRRGDGMRGDPDARVEKMQAELEELGFDLGDGGVDGRFGEGTEEAIRKLQQRHGLRVDGIAGEQTLRMLKRLIDKRKKEKEKRVTTGEDIEEAALDVVDAMACRQAAREVGSGAAFSRALLVEQEARTSLVERVGDEEAKRLVEVAIKYDPRFHPRGRTGRWIDALARMGIRTEGIEPDDGLTPDARRLMAKRRAARAKVTGERGPHVVGGLRIDPKALDQLSARAREVGAQKAVDDYIAKYSEKVGGPWEDIRPPLVRLVSDRLTGGGARTEGVMPMVGDRVMVAASGSPLVGRMGTLTRRMGGDALVKLDDADSPVRISDANASLRPVGMRSEGVRTGGADAFGRPLPPGAHYDPATGALTTSQGGVWFAGYGKPSPVRSEGVRSEGVGGKKERGRLIPGSAGSFLTPPGHPEQRFVIETDLRRKPENRTHLNLSSAVDDEWLEPGARAAARKALADWEKNKPSLDHPAVEEWVRYVLSYYRGSYATRGTEGAERWNVSNLEFDQELDPVENADRHAGVRMIRRYYPEYNPRVEDFAPGGYGQKAESLWHADVETDTALADKIRNSDLVRMTDSDVTFHRVKGEGLYRNATTAVRRGDREKIAYSAEQAIGWMRDPAELDFSKGASRDWRTGQDYWNGVPRDSRPGDTITYTAVGGARTEGIGPERIKPDRIVDSTEGGLPVMSPENYEMMRRHGYAGTGTPLNPNQPGWWVMARDEETGGTVLHTGVNVPGLSPVRTEGVGGGSRDLPSHLMGLGPGKHEITANGVPFTLYYDEQGAIGDSGSPVRGDKTGEWEVFLGHGDRLGRAVARVHVSPHGSSGYGNNAAPRYAAEQVAQAITKELRRRRVRTEGVGGNAERVEREARLLDDRKLSRLAADLGIDLPEPYGAVLDDMLAQTAEELGIEWPPGGARSEGVEGMSNEDFNLAMASMDARYHAAVQRGDNALANSLTGMMRVARARREGRAPTPTLDGIRAGDRVTIRTPQGQERAGRAVMRGPAGWVLNMGGAHGTPGIASEENIVKVRKGRRQPDSPAGALIRDLPPRARTEGVRPEQTRIQSEAMRREISGWGVPIREETLADGSRRLEWRTGTRTTVRVIAPDGSVRREGRDAPVRFEGLGDDRDIPAGFRDVDIEMRELEAQGTERARQRRRAAAPRRAAPPPGVMPQPYQAPAPIRERLGELRVGSPGYGFHANVWRTGPDEFEIRGSDRYGPPDVVRGSLEDTAARIEQEIAKQREGSARAARGTVDRSLVGSSRPFRGRVTLGLSQVPNDWAVAQGYAEYVPRREGGLEFQAIRWKEGVNPEAVVVHYLGGVRPPANFPAGSPAAAQFGFTGKGAGRTKEERRRKLMALAAAKDEGDEEKFWLLAEVLLHERNLEHLLEADTKLAAVEERLASIPDDRLSDGNRKALAEAQHRVESVRQLCEIV